MDIHVPLTAKKEEKKSLESTLGDYSIFIWTDKNFGERREQNREFITASWKEDDISKLAVSTAKKDIAKQAIQMLNYLTSNIEFAKLGDFKYARLGKGFHAARVFLTEAMNLALSDSPDDICRRLANQYFALVHEVVPFTFDTLNTSINKTLSIQQAMPQQKIGDVVVKSGGEDSPSS